MEIDVSNCKHYEDGICYNEGVLYKYCEQCPDCMPKQFQQLKKENEALKQSEQEGLEIITELKAENNELKKYIDRAGIIGIIKVLKCLDEIEEIVNFISNITNCDKAYYCKDKLDEILQKIKEVK